MSVIVYDAVESQSLIQPSLALIQKRYENIKNQMKKQAKSKEEIIQLKKILAQANQNLEELSPEKLLEFLKTNSTDILSNALETGAINTSNLISKNNYFFQYMKNYNNSIGKLIQLTEFANKKEGVIIKASEFNTSLLASNKIKGQIGKAANALGEIGTIGGNIKISSVLDGLLQDFGKNNKMIIVPTGTQKSNGQTITSDNVVLIIDSNGNLVANVNISNKFNTAYRANSKSTKNPVKMATRTVQHFLDQVQSNRNNYEIALFNFLSYHEAYSNGHFERIDLIPQYQKEWQNLRRAISAEMLYSMVQGTGNNINVNGYNIKDKIHLYAYGDKIFLHNDVINSAFNNRSRNISPATINLSKRAGWFQKRNWKGRPTEKIIKGEEEEVETQIKKFSIIYNQIIKF